MPSLRSQKAAFLDLLFLFLLSSFFLLYGLGRGSLASWDEAIYATVAKEIIQSGNWLRLTLSGGLWADKPPLCVWATALFYKLFGVNEFTARFFSALCGIGTVIVTYLFGCRLMNRWPAFLGALVLLSSSHYVHFARFGMTDAPLTFFISLALYFFWLGHERNRYLIFSGIAIGLAVMTKSFAGFFVFPIIWIYCWWSKDVEILTRSSYWIGVMIVAAIALPWNLYELVTNRSGYVNEAIVKHLFLRTFTSLEGHTGNLYYYIRILVNKYHPWILVAIVSAPFFLFKSIKKRFKEDIFLTVWMFFIFLVITLMQTKLDWYILPLYPALSLTVGYLLAKIFGEDQRNFVRAMFMVVMALHIPYSHIFNCDYSADIKGIAPLVQTEVPRDKMLYLYNYHEVNATLFYTDRKNAFLDDPESFISTAKSEKDFFCLIHEENLKMFENQLSKLGIVVNGSFDNLRLVSKKKHPSKR